MKAAFLDPNPVIMLEHKDFTGARSLEQKMRKRLNHPAIILFPWEKRW